MKMKNSLLAFVLTFFVLSLVSFGQQKEEWTKEKWEKAMQDAAVKIESYKKEVESLQNDINNLKATSSKIQSYDNCVDELYEMLGNAKKTEVDAFRKAVTELEGKIRRKEAPKADRQADLNALKKNPISALPEFYDRVHNQMQKMLDEWVEVVEGPKDVFYTVVKGDCLWYIARKKEFYGNGFAWPKIYQANREKIKNPDLIYPKQEFKIPPLTDEEQSKYEKLRKNYKPAPAK